MPVGSDNKASDDVTLIEAPGLRVQVAVPTPTFLAASLDVAPVAELVGLLVRQRLTGRLDIQSGGGTRSLYFEGGSYTGSQSTFSADRLGEVLWRKGRISLDQLMIAGELVKEGKMLGRALVELGFLESTDLRACLVEQALAVFQAACLDDKGSLVFVKDSYHRTPLRFGISTNDLVAQGLEDAAAHREVLGRLGRLDRPLLPKPPTPGSFGGFDAVPTTNTFDEAEQALLQLASSAKEPRTGAELIAASGLGGKDGARALWRLVERGRLVPRAMPADEGVRLQRLCQTVAMAMDALDEAGFGVADQVRDLVENPPAHLEEALSGLTLREPLDADNVAEQAKFLPGGLLEMNSALQAVLDEALLQAEDMLPAEVTVQIRRRVKALLPATAL
ncbi:MAG TPA: DUF4388 domain-containing protein [Myxococcota bacterium]